MRRQYTRNNRLDAILVFLHQDRTPETLRHICQEMDLNVTPYTRGLMATLINDGFVSVTLDDSQYPPKHLYTVTPDGAYVAQKIVENRSK